MSEQVFSNSITVYTESTPPIKKGSPFHSMVITNLSNGHYGVWSTKDGVFDWRGEFFHANLVIDRPGCFGTIA